MEVKRRPSRSAERKLSTPSQRKTLFQYSSCCNLTVSGSTTKDRKRAQPMRITQLLGIKPSNASVQKRMPERIPKIYTEANKVPPTLNDNEDNKFVEPIERNIRRNLNFNFTTPKKKVEKKQETNCLSIQQNKKSIYSNLNEDKTMKIKLNSTVMTNNTTQQRKSFLLPPNSIKDMYCKQQLVKSEQKQRNVPIKKGQTQRSLNFATIPEKIMANAKQNANLKEIRKGKQMSQNSKRLTNVETCSYNNKKGHVSRITTWKASENTIDTKRNNKRTLDKDKMSINVYKNGKSKYENSLEVEFSAFPIDTETEQLSCPSDIIYGYKDMRTCLNKDSCIEKHISDLNLEHLYEKLKSILSNLESNFINRNCFSLDSDTASCIRRDTLLLLEPNLKDIISVVHEHVNRIESTLNYVKEIINIDATKVKEEGFMQKLESFMKTCERNENKEYDKSNKTHMQSNDILSTTDKEIQVNISPKIDKDVLTTKLSKNTTIEFLQPEEDKENIEHFYSNSCKKNTRKTPQFTTFVSKAFTDSNEINISFEKMESELGILYATPVKSTPIYKVENCDSYDEPFLKEYMNLKSSFNVLETPQIKKCVSSSRKYQKTPLNMHADMHYISSRILQSIQDLYANSFET